MAPKPRSEQHKTGLYYAREAGFRHSEVRILPPQPASAVSVGYIQFIGKRPRLPRVKVRSPVSAVRNNVYRRPDLANLADSLRSRFFNIRIPFGETWLGRTETGSPFNKGAKLPTSLCNLCVAQYRLQIPFRRLAIPAVISPL
jgi:hypothetical protein